MTVNIKKCHAVSAEMNAQLLQASFTSALKHDLRTPILAQIMVLKLLLDNKYGKISASQREILSELLSSCIFLCSMTDNLLLKYNSAPKNKSKTLCNIAEIAQEVSESLKYMISSKKQTIHFHVNSASEPSVFANKQDIEQIIKNLIINALDYGDEHHNIDVFIETGGNNVKLSVGYSAKGENRDSLQKVFDESFCCDDRYQKIAHGLNLYASKQIVEAYNGNLTLKNNKNCGFLVSVSIPKKLKTCFKHFYLKNFQPTF